MTSDILLFAQVLWERRRAALELAGLSLGFIALAVAFIGGVLAYNALIH